MTYENFINLERIPTAFLLVRVSFSSIDFDGNFISVKDPDPRVRQMAFEQVPEYADGVYSTAYFITLQAERDLFNVRINRSSDVKLATLMKALIAELGARTRTDRENLDFFKKEITDGSQSGLIDMNYFSSY
jgi:hypothetical protein